MGRFTGNLIGKAGPPNAAAVLDEERVRELKGSLNFFRKSCENALPWSEGGTAAGGAAALSGLRGVSDGSHYNH